MNLKEKPFYLTDEQIEWVESMMDSMTLKEKVGQLFVICATEYSEEELEKLVGDRAIGGMLYRPTITFEEIRKKWEKYDKLAKYPLLKAANLEMGGSGIVSDGTFYSSQVGIGATADIKELERFAYACAYEGAKAGVNITYSPVSDITENFLNPIIPTRAFGSDVNMVKEFTRRYVEIIQEEGIAAAAKHFPGDGVDFRDQHLHPTYNSLSKEEWYDTYGSIYENMIDAGLYTIMAGHICQPDVQMDINPALTPESCLPASLSRELLQGVLREKFAFNGLIVTDATIMSGFIAAMERRMAIPKAIEAGCDMLVFSPAIYEDIQFILDAVREGRLSNERIDEAVLRILALKAKVALKAPDAKEVPVKEWAKEAADKAVTLVKNTKGIIPLDKTKYDRVRIISKGNDSIPGGESLKAYFIERMKKEGFETEVYEPSFDDDMGPVSELDKRMLTIYLVNMEDISNNTSTRLYWFPKHAMEIPRYVEEIDYVFISFAYPFHLMDVPRIKAYINAYSGNEECAASVCDKMFGIGEFKGKNPVDPFCDLVDTRI